jgi:hypothetical protein
MNKPIRAIYQWTISIIVSLMILAVIFVFMLLVFAILSGLWNIIVIILGTGFIMGLFYALVYGVKSNLFK